MGSLTKDDRMTERNKLLAVLIVGLLVGFGLGRLIPGVNSEVVVGEDDGSADAVIVTGEDNVQITETPSDAAETKGQLSASLSGSLTASDLDRPQKTASGVGLKLLDQPAGESVEVSSVAVTMPTWVAVHADRNGRPGNVLGARLVDSNTSGLVISLLRATQAQETYYVLLQEDNGNGSYDLYDDPELVSLAGELIADAFVAK